MCIKARNGTVLLALEASPSPGWGPREHRGKLCASVARAAAEGTSGSPVPSGSVIHWETG